MKKIGKEVLFLAVDDICKRNGEGAFIRLKDNSIMFAYSEFIGESWADHSEAVISAYFSYDEGETWTNKKVIAKRADDAENVMSVSLLRMNNGDLGLFYGQKKLIDDKLNVEYILTRSADEGKTWSEPTICIPPVSYRILNNDRVMRLQSGRIVLPISLGETKKGELYKLDPGIISVFYSDDDGITWQEGQRIDRIFENDRFGLQEPGVYQHEDGSLRMWCRTFLGFQYEAFSKDEGETWSAIQPNYCFASPISPMQMKKVGKYTVSIFNPIPYPSPFIKDEATEVHRSGRTPFICAVSENDGEHFTKAYYLEDDLTNAYCYPAIFDGDSYFLTAYYHSNNTDNELSSMKIVKVSYDELTS